MTPRIRYKEDVITVMDFAVMLCILHHGRKSIHHGKSKPCPDCEAEALLAFAV